MTPNPALNPDAVHPWRAGDADTLCGFGRHAGSGPAMTD
jgi:hypothetical protein